MLGTIVCDIGALRPEEVDLPQGRSRWRAIQPCWHHRGSLLRARKGEGKHPAVLQAPLGLFAFEKRKSGKTQT